MFDFLCRTERNFFYLLRRRMVTFPFYYLLFGGITIFCFVLFLPALIVDLITLRLRYLRRIGWGIFYSMWGMIFVTTAIVLFPVRLLLRFFGDDASRAIPGFLKKLYYTGIARGFRFLYSVKFHVTGDELLRKDRSYLVFINHTAFIDPIFPVEVIMWQRKITLRHVLWRGLLLDAAIDLGVTGFDEAVVDPDNREEYQEDIRQMTALIARQKPGHGAAIYPEGGVEAVPGEKKLYENLNNPRIAGMLLFLEEDEDSDLVFVAHRGLRPGKYPTDIWRGAMTGHTIDMNLRVIPRSEVPEDIDEREKFLIEAWARMDRWIGGGQNG